MGVVRTRQKRRRFQLPNKGEITALAVGHELNSVYAGTASGQIIRMGLPAGALEKSVDVIGATPDPAVAVTLLRFLHGGSTLIAGDQKGRVFSAQVVRGKKNIFRVEWVHAFQAHAHPVTLISYSQRDKGFVTGDASGLLQYHYATSGQTEYTLASGLPGDLAGLVLAPKGDGLLALDRNGRLGHWRVDHPHPGITWNALFGEVRYEGYSDAQYMWQSTGGTDEFEPKFSLVPLIFGTLKGTFYALFFAAPLALLAAFYASQFMHRSLMRVVKPTVEYMAALPSVVLGFLGALWLAPRVEELLPSMLLMPLVVLLMVFAFRFLSDFTEMKHLITQRPGVEFWILLALVLGGGVLAVFLGEWCEAVFFGGDFRPWVRSTLGLTYDQRNSLVVGMAMGFSVVPIIFTIAEDSLSSVPQHLTAASLALGATRWQTALRVVLPTASPGIFSGVMIGFGRAVGETMIVLMATGNTPVMDLSPFTGFRALSANIAVELPEAPEGGTLFRV
ncbi:MAG: ABC transporter permease subunit, partial [Nitrospinaceae bacterium]